MYIYFFKENMFFFKQISNLFQNKRTGKENASIFKSMSSGYDVLFNQICTCWLGVPQKQRHFIPRRENMVHQEWEVICHELHKHTSGFGTSYLTPVI